MGHDVLPGKAAEPTEIVKKLTPRQREVVRLAAAGLTIRQTARHLELSERTIDHHLAQARTRTGVATTKELVALAVAAGVAALGRSSAVPGTSVPGWQRDTRTPVPRQVGRPTVMTPERIAQAAELLDVHTTSSIARKLGVCRSTLYAHRDAIQAARIARRHGRLRVTST